MKIMMNDSRIQSIAQLQEFLTPGITFEALGTIAYSYSDNEFATIMREEERRLTILLHLFN